MAALADATALAGLVAAGAVHPRELVAEAIARIDAADPTLNFMVHRQFERAMTDAAGPLPGGPLRGVPFLFKDYLAQEAGERYCAGMGLLRALDYRPDRDSGLAVAVRAAGLIPLGRTSTPELALMGTTEPDAFGPTRNPWDTGRSPGGSSGGSAAAVAAGCVPLAHANDIAGSIRIPAAHCGLVGLKPTRGRTITSLGHDRASGLFVEGALTRTVRDAGAMFDVLTGVAGEGWWAAPPVGSLREALARDPGRCRVGLCVAAFNGAAVEAGCRAAAEMAGTLLEGLGHAVDPVVPPGYGAADLAAAMRGLIAANAANEVAQWERRLGRSIGEADVEPASWATIATGRAMSAPEVLDLLDVVQTRAREVATWWASSGIDLLVTPTTGEGPPHLGDYKANYTPGRASAFTRPINATGQPSISLPLGWPGDGLPRGAQLVAAHGREDLLVQVAAQLEAAAPWADRYLALSP